MNVCVHSKLTINLDLLPPTSYIIADNVVYLAICEKSYPRRLAFSYLDELSKEFQNSYGAKVEGVRKPYAFVGFGESLVSHKSVGAHFIAPQYQSMFSP